MADVPYDSALIKLRADETIESPARRALRRLKRRKGAIFGLVVIVIFVLLAVFAPLISPFDPAAQSWTSVRKAPSALHWMGTDDVGRDVLARVSGSHHGRARVCRVRTADRRRAPSL